MATDQSMELNFWERIGDFFSGVTEWVSKLLTGLFGSSNERYIRGMGYVASKDPKVPPVITPGSLLHQVNRLEDGMRAKSDDEFRGMAAQWREKLAQGATLDSLLVEVFAACREVARRTK